MFIEIWGVYYHILFDNSDYNGIGNNEQSKAEMGTGLVMPGDGGDIFPFGHMWIWWQEKDMPRQFRGYYPLVDDIVLSILHSDNYFTILKFFASIKSDHPKKRVRGFYQDDIDAEDMMNESPDSIFQKKWRINHEQLERLETRCKLPENKSRKFEGYYSWNRKDPNSQNCPAWVLKVLYHVLREPIFLKCPSPRQLNTVMRFIQEKITWDYTPLKYRLSKNSEEERK